MAETGQLTAIADAHALPRSAKRTVLAGSVQALRLGFILFLFAAWEICSRSGFVPPEIVPPVTSVLTALGRILADPAFYWNLKATAYEVAGAMLIGTAGGLVVGLALGASRVLGGMFEPYVYYVSPTPRIILFPIMLMLFGVGAESKIALGALSTFFPVALTTAAGMRGIDQVLIRVGKSFRASQVQMATKIYLPAMRTPVFNGIRLGFGNALITALLAETKLSKEGLGFMLMQIYSKFDMAALYGLLIIVFAISAVMSVVMGKIAGVRA